MALSQGDTFRTYEILAHLGQGGMGSVYLAIDKKLNRKVAIKMVKAEVISDPSVLARTKREGQVLSRLSHPSIARVYDMDWADSVPFMVQQYIGGERPGYPSGRWSSVHRKRRMETPSRTG